MLFHSTTYFTFYHTATNRTSGIYISILKTRLHLRYSTCANTSLPPVLLVIHSEQTKEISLTTIIIPSLLSQVHTAFPYLEHCILNSQIINLCMIIFEHFLQYLYCIFHIFQSFPSCLSPQSVTFSKSLSLSFPVSDKTDSTFLN